MTDIEPIHAWAYANGVDPIDHAITLARTQIEARDQIRTARVHTPTAYPIFRGDLGDDATARRIIADLMNAGWTPPPTPDLETAHAQT